MTVQSTSALPFSSALTRSSSARQYFAASSANAADTGNNFQAVRDRYAVAAAPSNPAASGGGGAKAEFDTSKGTIELDIESYFAPPAGRGVNLDSVPLLSPSQKNIAALASYISTRMRDFLADNGIPSAPASITYDTMGQIQLPADYPHAEKFKQALKDNPVLERVLSTTSALTSCMVEMNKSVPFLREYAAASSQAQIEAVVAKYHYLFSANRRHDSIALNFTADGSLSITHDGKPLAKA